MTVPRYHEMMLPVLRKLGDDPDLSFTNKQIREYVADCFALDDDDKAEAISSGFARYINNAQWACTYLKQARLIESPKRGLFKITSRGQRVLDSGVAKIDRAYLMQYPEFCEFTTRSKKTVRPKKCALFSKRKTRQLRTILWKPRFKASNRLWSPNCLS